MKVNVERLKLSYLFFSNAVKTKSFFTLDDLVKETRWSKSTVRTYAGKKWENFLRKENQLYFVEPSSFSFSESEYIRMMSQVNRYSSNPYKPDLPENVEGLVEKAKESAILAIDIYNRPMTSFRSQGFIVMMIIAWTSLLHSIFEYENIDYYYYEDYGKIKIIDGDKKAWELTECIKNSGFISHAIKENLKFFIQLRNKIEHRYAPAFDLDICGECQALLFNFEDLITKHFGIYYSLNATLTIPMQVMTARAPWQIENLKKFQSKHYQELKTFIENYRKDLSVEVYSDANYCFRVYLIPKTGNHQSSSDMTMEFIQYDPSHPEKFEDLERAITITKEKHIQVANQGFFKPTTVSNTVAQRIGRRFGITEHTKAWNYYKVRKKGKQPDGCKTKFCQYDIPHKDYIYTQEWVDFLVTNLAEEEEYQKVISHK